MDTPNERRYKRVKQTNANSARTQRNANANQWSSTQWPQHTQNSAQSANDSSPVDYRHKYLNFMAREFETMVNNQEFSDFTFTVNGVIYYAHKNILASRSPVFAAMFRSNMSETQTNNVVIDDCDCNVFEVFLNYIYTSDVSKLKQFACELFAIADKYQVMALKTYCENSIEIENKNAIKVLIMAHLYNAEKLKKNAINHIIGNLRAIRTTHANEFEQLLKEYPQLVNGIFDVIQNMNHFRSPREEYRVNDANYYGDDEWFAHNGDW